MTSHTAGRRDGVLMVGQGAPARGGIPSVIDTLLGDTELRAQVPITFLNTTRAPGRPGAVTVGNLRASLRDLPPVFAGARRARIVHLHLAPAPLLPLMRACALVAAARIAGAKVLVHAHSGRMHTAAAASSAYRLGLRALVALTNAIVVVSDDGARATTAAGGDPILLENAVDTEAFPVSEGERGATLVFVGTVCERKGLDDLRRALELLRDRGDPDAMPSEVVIVGDGRQEGPGVFERVRDRYVASGLIPRVRFTGALEPEDVRTALGAASVFCLPSHWEGLPISMLEAMAAGCAVVATRVGQIEATLGGDGVLVDAHDPEGLAGAIAGLMTDPARRARLGEEARRRVRERFGLATFRQRLLAIYAELGYSR